MIRYVLFILINIGGVMGNMDSAKREGEAFARSQKSLKGHLPTTRQDPKDVLPTADKGKTFNASKALQDVDSARVPKTPVDNLQPKTPYDLRSDDPMFTAGDRVTDHPEAILNATITQRETGAEYANKTCRESGKPYPITVVRNLRVDVKYTPLIKKKVKVCQGHHLKRENLLGGISGANADFKSYHRNRLEEDKDVDAGTIRTWTNSGLLFDDACVFWKHIEDAQSCDKYRFQDKVIQEEKWEEVGEEWVAEDPATYMKGRGPDCRLTHRDVLTGPETRIINGKAVSRNSWKDKQTYHCQYPPVKGCEGLRAAKCEEQSQTCVQPGVGGTCALWEKMFRCKTKSGRLVTTASSRDALYCLDGNCIDTSYNDNQQFGEVMTKLSVFNEIKKDLDKQKQFNAEDAQVFGGETLKCHKNVCETLMYDCCGSLDGFTNMIGLSRCDAEEKALSERKKAGHCHYVGSKSESFLGFLWKSRDVHSYCCFPSKFMRVLQEKAREQLGKSWGWGGAPNCEGLTMHEIKRLRFDLMDLSEAYEDQLRTLKERNKGDVAKQFENERAVKAKLEKRMKDLQRDTRR
jgi:conjugal transfer mating pair stabilization protein TraN